jgi:hypothetical protein
MKLHYIYYQIGLKERMRSQPNTPPSGAVPHISRTVNAIDPTGIDGSRV